MKLLISLITLLGLLYGGWVQAETKIATVDVNRVINELPEAKIKRKELDDKAAQVRKKIETQRAALLEQEKKLKAAKVIDTSPEAEKFRADARSYEHLVRDSDEDLRKEFLRLNKDMTDKVFKVVAAYAKTNKIDLILDKSESSRGAVLFGEPGTDITEAIIKQLNS
jgi:outer membrane protein